MWNSLKRFAWFWLKSPQRKLLGFSTVFTDLKGLMEIAVYPKPRGTVWICVGNKDRSEALKRLILSLNENTEADFGLSVADAGSADAKSLHSWIQKHWTRPLIWSEAEEVFSRSKVFNRAIRQAPGDLVMVCDADMTVPHDLEQRIRSFIRPHAAWFPVCQYQLHQDDEAWKWLSAGTGLLAMHKTWHAGAGLLDETIAEWGGEDWDWFFRFYRTGIVPIRTRETGLYHHWHASLAPDSFTALF